MWRTKLFCLPTLWIFGKFRNFEKQNHQSRSTSTLARGKDIPCYRYMSPLSFTRTHMPITRYIFPSKRCTPTREDTEEIGFVQCKRNLKESNSDFTFASSYRLVSGFRPKRNTLFRTHNLVLGDGKMVTSHKA